MVRVETNDISFILKLNRFEIFDKKIVLFCFKHNNCEVIVYREQGRERDRDRGKGREIDRKKRERKREREGGRDTQREGERDSER